jgi:hypothetical protein
VCEAWLCTTITRKRPTFHEAQGVFAQPPIAKFNNILSSTSQELSLDSVEVCVVGAVKQLAKEMFLALPGIVAFFMAALALAVIYMDELQTKLKDQRAIRWIVAFVLIAMGAGAFISDRVQKGEEQANTEQKIKETAVETAQNLSPKVAAQTAAQVSDQLNKDYGIVISELYKEIGVLQVQQQSQINIVKKQFALNSAISMEVFYAGYLQLWNRGNNNVYVCGQKYDGDLASAIKPFEITPKNGFSLVTDFNSFVRQRLGDNAQTEVPYDVYLLNEDHKKYVMHNILIETVTNGVVTVHAQTRGYEAAKECPSS